MRCDAGGLVVQDDAGGVIYVTWPNSGAVIGIQERSCEAGSEAKPSGLPRPLRKLLRQRRAQEVDQLVPLHGGGEAGGLPMPTPALEPGDA